MQQKTLLLVLSGTASTDFSLTVFVNLESNGRRKIDGY
jgi:hypothetical protein